jgi:hypothetical protein
MTKLHILFIIALFSAAVGLLTRVASGKKKPLDWIFAELESYAAERTNDLHG